jgi:aryl-alcohol dehydrogenase-like predicted oxidoreductase
MDYRKLGKSDLNVSRIAFGCMSLKGTEAENERIIHQAMEYGINYFDTADIYDNGRNEEALGKAIKEVRSSLIIASKVGNQPRADGSGLDWNPRKEYILKQVEGSLQRLQTDYIDLYQLHGGTINDPVDETIDAFETLKQQGKIRHYGISSIRPNVIREYVQRSTMVSVMMQYSLLDRRAEEEAFQLLQEHNISVVARGTVATGLLVDKEPKAYLNYTTEQVKEAAAIIAELSKNRTAAQTAIQFALHHPAVTSAVVGIRTLEQLKEAAEVFSVPALAEEELQQLSSAIDVNFYQEHRN